MIIIILCKKLKVKLDHRKPSRLDFEKSGYDLRSSPKEERSPEKLRSGKARSLPPVFSPRRRSSAKISLLPKVEENEEEAKLQDDPNPSRYLDRINEFKVFLFPFYSITFS